MEPIDMEQDAKTVLPSDAGLAKVAELASLVIRLETDIAEREADINTIKERLRQVQESLLPEAMATIGVAEFKLEDGSKVTVKPFYSAKIGDDNREVCHTWLRDHGFTELIKHEIVVQVNRGKDDQAKQLAKVANELQLPFVDKEGVHPSTLTAFVKEQVEKGSDLPLEQFKVFIGRKAKVAGAKRKEEF